MEIFKNMKKERKKELLVLTIFAIFFIFVTYKFKQNGKNFFLVISFLAIYLAVGADTIVNAINSISNKKFMDENFLITLASFIAFFMGFFVDACAIMFLFNLGKFFENLSKDMIDENFKKLLDIVPKTVTKVLDDGALAKISIKKIKKGDILLAKEADIIPVDSVVISGEGLLDTSFLNGKSLPIEIKKGSEILSTSMLKTGEIKYKAVKVFDESMAAKIINLIKKSRNKKSQSEKLIKQFTKIYTPCLVAIAIFLAVVFPILGGDLSKYLQKSASFLIVSCPKVFILGISLSYISALILANKNKILVKDIKSFEKLIDCDYFYTDMTNTLTIGEFDLKEIVYYSPYNKNLLLDYLYNLEKLSADPIAKAIVKNLRRRDNFSYFIASKNINDIDIWAKTYENEEIKIGSKDFVNAEDDSNEKAIYMSINNILVCKVVLEDNIKDDAKESLDYLKNEFSDIAVLSAEKEKVVENLAKNLSISYAAEISTNEKVEIINNEQKNKHKIIYVGDGIKEGEVLKNSDIGISMGQKSSDIAIYSSDIMISDKSYGKLRDLMKIAKIVDKTAKKNLILLIFTRIVLLILTLIGYCPMWLVSLVDVVVLIISILSSIKIFNKKI